MKPLLILIVTFIIAAIVLHILHGSYDIALAGRIAMSAMLVFTAIGHFAFTNGMAMMVPAFIPFKKTIVYITGIVEVVAAVGLVIEGCHHVAGWFLVLFFVAMLPANIYAAINHVNYEKGSAEGNGLGYLWFRIPLQLLFIGWVYISAILD